MTASKPRLREIDVLRGLIMAVMAFDHVGLMVGRFHSQEMWAGAWTRYEGALPFLTRFVTHFCAPGFFLLMGAGMALMADARTRQGWAAGTISRSLVTRGLLLVVVATFLEVPAFLIATLSGPPLGDNPDFAIPGTPERRWVLTVLFALGVSMAVGGLLIRARTAVWALLAVAALLVTAATTPGPEHMDTLYSLERSVLLLSRWSRGIWSQYPLIPWFGIAAMGVLLGRALAADRGRTLRALPWIGVGAAALALLLRDLGGFGNLRDPRDGSWIEHLWLFALIGVAWFRGGTGYGTVYAIWLAGLVPLYHLTRWYGGFVAQQPEGSLWKNL